MRSSAKSCESIFETFPEILEPKKTQTFNQEKRDEEKEDSEQQNQISNENKMPKLNELFSQESVLKNPKNYFKIVYSASKIT